MGYGQVCSCAELRCGSAGSWGHGPNPVITAHMVTAAADTLDNYAALTLGVTAGVEQRVGPLAAAGERVVGEAGVAGEAEVRGDGAAGHHLQPRHAAARGEEAGRAGHAPRPAHQHAAGGRGGGVRGRGCGLGQSGQGGWSVGLAL